jgi:hypothetical protein
MLSGLMAFLYYGNLSEIKGLQSAVKGLEPFILITKLLALETCSFVGGFKWFRLRKQQKLRFNV